MDLGISERVAPLIKAVRDMVENDIAPLDAEYHALVGTHPTGDRFKHTDRQLEILDGLKSLARKRGLWNFWLTDSERGYGLSTVEYAYLAEEMGKVGIAAEVFNCNAPDTGNMEVLERYGTQEHKDRWLNDLLDGKIRSAYVMTEPNTASSDAAQLSFEAKKDGDEWVLNGENGGFRGRVTPVVRCISLWPVAILTRQNTAVTPCSLWMLTHRASKFCAPCRCSAMMMRPMGICTCALPTFASLPVRLFWAKDVGLRLPKGALDRGAFTIACVRLDRRKKHWK